MCCEFPCIDMVATGKNIAMLRKKRGLSVRQLQEYFGFEQPQAIYKWQWGKCIPSVDNLYALSVILQVSIDEILVGNNRDVSFFAGVAALQALPLNYRFNALLPQKKYNALVG